MLNRNTTPLFTTEQVEWLEHKYQEIVDLSSTVTDRDIYYNMGRRRVIRDIRIAIDYHRRKAAEGK